MFDTIHINVFSKDSKDLYAYIAKILRRILFFDLMLGVNVNLYSPKVQKTCMGAKP
jgi:hypothetical protein